MDIYTAVKKERKNLKIFFGLMIFIAAVLPVAVILTNLTTPFYLIYVGIVEFLIVISIIIRLNGYKVSYRCINNRLMFKTGILTKENLIICDRVALVHTNKSDYDLEIILITSVKFRNKKLRKVEDSFFKRYPQLKDEYESIQNLNSNREYYFQVIRRGGLRKYLLLDCIYKNCVKAIYSDESIQNIKIARGQTIV